MIKKLTKITAPIIITISIFVGCSINNDTNIPMDSGKSAEQIAQKFLNTISKKDYDSAVKMLDFPEQSIIDIDNFKEILESNNMIFENIKKIKVHNPNVDNTGDVTVNGEIILNDKSSITIGIDTVLNKDNNWKINSDIFMDKDMTITTIKGSEIYINDKEIEVKSEDININVGRNVVNGSIYKIPAIIKGDYKLKIDNKLGELIEMDSISSTSNIEIVIKPTEGVKAIGEDAIKQFIKTTFDGAKDYKSINQFSDIIDTTSINHPKLSEDYNKLKEELKSGLKNNKSTYKFSNLRYSDIVISNIDITDKDMIKIDGNFEVSYEENDQALDTNITKSFNKIFTASYIIEDGKYKLQNAEGIFDIFY